MNEHLTLLAAFLLGTLGVARATRLVVADTWPPMVWLRLRWATWTAQTERREGWEPLLSCPWCASPWLAAGSLTWAYLADLPTAWWLVHLWLAGSMLAGMIVLRDEPPEEG